MATTTPHTPPPAQRSSGRGTFYFLQTTVLVAVVLATLFTAWTDPGLLPGSFSQSVAMSSLPQSTQTAEVLATPTPRTKPLIGIVVGHWDDTSKDPGAICSDINLTELQINQNVATRVRDQLIAKNIDVELLKEFDPKLQGYKASALVSIHADSCDYINDQATGFKVAAAMANPQPQLSARLTGCLRQRYAQATGLKLHSSITADMSSYHAFDEIDQNTTAAIIEVGFLNLDRDILTQGVDKVAQGVTDGILCFINNEHIPFDIPPTASEDASPAGIELPPAEATAIPQTIP